MGEWLDNSLDLTRLRERRDAYRARVGAERYSATVDTMTFTLTAFADGKHPGDAAESVLLQLTSQLKGDPEAISAALEMAVFAYADALDAFNAREATS